MKKKIMCLVSCMLLLVSMVSGCGGSNGTKESTDSEGLKELKFGVSAPLTGPFSKTGIETKDAVTLRLEELDYQLGDYKLVPVWIDDQGDPERGVRAYEQAVISDKIQASLFCNFSSVAVAEMEIAAKYQIPHFVSWGASQIVDEKWHTDDKYSVWLKGFPQPVKMSIAYVEAIENMISTGAWEPSAKKFYVYGEDNDWGRAIGTGMGAEFEKAGWERVGEDYFKPGETDFYSLLSKMKSSGATVLVGTVNSAPSSSSFVKQAREVNVPALIVCEAVSETGDFYQLTGDASNGVLDCRAAYLNDPQRGEEFNKKFEERFGYPTSAANGGFNADCFDYFLKIVEETDKKYGDVNSETLYKFSLEEIQTGNFTWSEGMVMPEIRYSPDTLPDPVVAKDAYYNPVLQFEDGVPHIVFPTEYATKEFEIPDYAK